MSRMIIGIIGIGILGTALKNTFETFGLNVVCYDKYKNIGESLNDLLICNIIFLCLPTLFDYENCEYNKDSICDTIKFLSENNFSGDVILKSTVEPGTTKELQNKYFNINLIHNPEFLSAKTATHDFMNQTHIVIGMPRDNDNTIINNFFKTYFPLAEISITNSNSSEMMKIACNSFYATKIQYFTEIKLLCDDLNINYNSVKDLMLKNGWINSMHTDVPGHDGKLSFGGACFPKDINALNQVLKKKNITNTVIQAVVDENKKMRP
jgi:nucleotide sugar dehydrogenase